MSKKPANAGFEEIGQYTPAVHSSALSVLVGVVSARLAESWQQDSSFDSFFLFFNVVSFTCRLHIR
ncbi:hypothetical protein ELZ22_06895 [Brucella abortus]|nr:hypothetical protein ELZ22_06895 [Brucella abortus]RYV42526.1 hypothetical protein EVD24_09725 [Brucella abortus]